jgi:hypothetical protein
MKVARTLGRRRRSAVLLGESCLTEAVREQDARAVARLILSSAPRLADACRKYGSHSFQAAARRQIQQDFEAAMVVNVTGYILSVTECRLYSLAALMERQRL